MKSIIKSKKASTSIAITILAVFTLILAVFTWSMFIKKQAGQNFEITGVEAIRYIYTQEDKINLYLSKGISIDESLKSACNTQKQVSCSYSEDTKRIKIIIAYFKNKDSTNQEILKYEFYPKLKQ